MAKKSVFSFVAALTTAFLTVSSALADDVFAVESFTKYDREASSYTVPATANFVVVKKASSDFVIWTRDELTGAQLTAIEEFASSGRIGYVHFRNTSGTLPRYSEVFIDDGYVDMKRAMSIYKKCGFEGTIIPDHTPRLDAADWWETGMAFALGYMRGLIG